MNHVDTRNTDSPTLTNPMQQLHTYSTITLFASTYVETSQRRIDMQRLLSIGLLVFALA